MDIFPTVVIMTDVTCSFPWSVDESQCWQTESSVIFPVWRFSWTLMWSSLYDVTQHELELTHVWLNRAFLCSNERTCSLKETLLNGANIRMCVSVKARPLVLTEKQEDYFLLCDVLPEDRILRERLQQKRLVRGGTTKHQTHLSASAECRLSVCPDVCFLTVSPTQQEAALFFFFCCVSLTVLLLHRRRCWRSSRWRETTAAFIISACSAVKSSQETGTGIRQQSVRKWKTCQSRTLLINEPLITLHKLDQLQQGRSDVFLDVTETVNK